MLRRGNVLTFILAICLTVCGVSIPAYADDGAKEVKILDPITLGKINVKENVTAEINDLIMLPAESNQIIGFTLRIKNNSAAEINFLDYWINVTTNAGVKLSVKIVGNPTPKITAKSTLDIPFYSIVGANIKLTDLTISMIKWDFSSASYMKTLGKVTVPQRYNPVVSPDNGRIITTDSQQATFIIDRVTWGNSESYYRPEIQLKVKNDGKRSITLPDYQLYIMNKDNLMYPLNATNLKGTVIDPLAEKEFQLNASIPIAVNNTGWKLAVMYPIEEGKASFPLGIFELPKASTGTAGEVGKYYTFNNAQGTYYARLDSLNRLPIEDDDLIIANLTIANRGTNTLSVPDLTGVFKFNEAIQKNATSISNDKVISIKGNDSVSIQLVSRVPYTFDISKVQLTLQQKEANEEKPLNLVEFTNLGVFDAVPSVLWSTGYSISDVGYRAKVKATNKMLYEGATANIIAVEVAVENEEKRLTEPQKLAGFFEKPDGAIYPATFNNITGKMPTGAKSIVTAWASIPKQVDIADIRLVVGKAVTEKGEEAAGAAATETLTGYASPYKFTLPAEFETKDNLQNIILQPFALSFSMIDTKMDYENGIVKLILNYELLQDLLVRSDLKDDKIIVEIKDPGYDKSFSKELSLPDGTENSNAGESGLLVGKHSMEFTWTDQIFALSIQRLKEFEFNIYHQIQPGYKKLIATQKIDWFVKTSLSQ